MGLRTALGLKRPKENRAPTQQLSPAPQVPNEAIRSSLNPHYPANVKTSANRPTVDTIKRFGCSRIAEFGILNGDTTLEIAKTIPASGAIHVFDFQHNVDLVLERLKANGFNNVVGHGTSSKLLDNYNWSLSKLLEEQSSAMFDYAFIDGAHTWNVDALTFFLVDRLLTVGGLIDFDDYEWSLQISPTLNPEKFPKTREMYTNDQINDQQIKRVVDLLVKRDPRYEEVVSNKVYRKIA